MDKNKVANAASKRKLRFFVGLTGFFEFATSFLLLFFPDAYKDLFGLSTAFDSYYIRQIGMFEFLVGSTILYGAFDRQIRPFAMCAIWFHVACLPFEAAYAVSRWQEGGLFPLSMAFFVIFHIVMLSFLIPAFRKCGYRFFETAIHGAG